MFLAVAAAVLLAPLGLAAAEPLEETFSKTYALAKGGVVSLSNVNGNVLVKAWDQPRVKVEATKEASSRELLEELTVDVEASEKSVRIRTRYPNARSIGGTRGHMSVSYVLTVP